MYDTFRDADLAVQLKVGSNHYYIYNVGDLVRGVQDGIYFGYEGVVVIQHERVRSVTEAVPEDAPALPKMTKWGDPFDPLTEDLSDYNPLGRLVAAFRAPNSNG